MDASSAAATNEDASESISAFKQKLVQHKRRGNDLNRLDDVGEMIDASLLLATESNANVRQSSQNDRLYPLDMSSVANEAVEDVYTGPCFGIRDFRGFGLYFFDWNRRVLFVHGIRS